MAPRIGRSRLPELMANKGWSQAEFARRLGVSKGFISRVIAGERYFSYPLAVKAAWLLDCNLDDLHEITY